MKFSFYISMFILISGNLMMSRIHAESDPGTSSTAGPDQVRSIEDRVVLQAAKPLGYNGSWLVVSGPSTAQSQFSDHSDPRSLFIPAGGPGVYQLQWCVGTNLTSLGCDEVTLSFFPPEETPRILIPDLFYHPFSSTIIQGRIYGTTELNNSRLFFKIDPPFITPIQTFNWARVVPHHWDQFLFMAVNEAETGTELWRFETDTENLTLIKDISPGPTSGFMGDGVAMDGVFYFSGGSPISTLWRSDGTPEGTYAVTSFDKVISPNEFIVMNHIVYFRGGSSTGWELWRSDGTDQGTYLVKDINPGSQHASPRNLTVAGGLLYFRAEHPDHGFDLWRSDGTEKGTHIVADLPHETDNVFAHMHELNGQLTFSIVARDPISAVRQLWITDGSPEGTYRLTDLPICGTASFKYNGHVYFNTSFPTCDLYKTDGSDITLVQHELDLTEGGLEHNGIYYFNASGLWRTDGEPAGTWPIPSVPNTARNMISHGTDLYFHSSLDQPSGRGSLNKMNPDARSGSIAVSTVTCNNTLYQAEAMALPGNVQLTWLVANGRIIEGQGTDTITLDTEETGALFLSLLVESPGHAPYYIESTTEVIDYHFAQWNAPYSGPEDLNANQCLDILDLAILTGRCY